MNYDSYIDYSLEHFVPAKEKWNYEDGCVLQGAVYLYQVTGEEKYKDFVLNYLNDFISEDGQIKGYKEEDYNIDSIQPGRVVMAAMDWLPEEEKFQTAVETLRHQLENQPRCEIGNFWHKQIYPYQVWLDGLYMGQPFYAAYDTRFGKKENYRDIKDQFLNVRKHLFVEDKKLYMHAYDEKRVQPWADSETGLSPNFWLRAIGWYLVGIVDTYEEMAEMVFEMREALVPLFQEAIEGLMPYRDEETGLFYDLVALPNLDGNYIETSGSLLVAYSILKACRLKMINPDIYLPIGKAMLETVHDTFLVKSGDHFTLTSMVEVSGLGPGDKRDGSVEYYLSEPIVADDHKGMGAFMMAYSELLRTESQA